MPSHPDRVRANYDDDAPKDAAWLLKFYEWVQSIDPDVVEQFELAQASEELTEN